MTVPLTSAHRRVVQRETLISTAINALVPAAIIWIVDAAPPQRLTGSNSILGVLVPASGLATLLMTFAVTFIVRAQVAKGAVARLDWPRSARGLYRFIPQNLVLRAVALAFLAVVLLVPATWGVVALTGILPLTKTGALFFNIGYGALVGLTMTRLVVLTALADRGCGMTGLSLDIANRIALAALAEAGSHGFAPMCVTVVDAGCHALVTMRDERASLYRQAIAEAKAAGCLGMGFGGREIARRAAAMPGLYNAVAVMTGGGLVPVAGGVLIRDANGALLGAAGMSGDTADNDELCVVAGIVAAGLTPDTGAAA